MSVDTVNPVVEERKAAFVATVWKVITCVPRWVWRNAKLLAAVVSGIVLFLSLVWLAFVVPFWVFAVIGVVMLAVCGWLIDHFHTKEVK